MPRVSRAISALAAIAIPPLPLPQFSEPSQLGRTPYWDRYVTVMPALFKCKQSEAPALTLSATPQLFRKAFGTSSTPLSLLFSFARADESIPMFDADKPNISLHDFHLSAMQLFVLFGHLPSFSSKPPSPLSSTNNYFEQVRGESSQEARVKCPVKTRFG